MAQTIKIDQLADTVMKGMEEYAKLAADNLKKDVQKAGKTVKQQIESAAVEGQGHSRISHRRSRQVPCS